MKRLPDMAQCLKHNQKSVTVNDPFVMQRLQAAPPRINWPLVFEKRTGDPTAKFFLNFGLLLFCGLFS